MNLLTHLHIIHIKIDFMTLLNILLILVVVGVILWIVNSYIPMARSIKKIFNVVVVVAVVVWLLQEFGLFNSLRNLNV